MFYNFTWWAFWLPAWQILCLRVSAESKCNNKLISSINITTELQSDVLLPCFFEPTLLGSDQTADIAAVWSQRNITTDNLLEITLQGVVMSWTNRGGRLKSFSKLSKSGNFSILLKDVQQSDLGLYRCQLFEGINCSIAYQEISLQLVLFSARTSHEPGLMNWLWPFVGGGAVLFILLAVSLYFAQHTCKKASNNSVYANTGYNQRKAVDINREERRRKSPEFRTGVNDKSPENHTANIYANKCMEAGHIYANQRH